MTNDPGIESDFEQSLSTNLSNLRLSSTLSSPLQPTEEINHDMESGENDWEDVALGSYKSDPKEELELLLEELKPLIQSYLENGTNEEAPVVEYHSPKELMEILGYDFHDKGVGINGILNIIRDVLKYSVNTWNPRFLYKLYAATNPIGVVSELLLGLINNNSHTFTASPSLTVIEIKVAKQLAQLFGFSNGSGVTCPGGAASNILSLITARNFIFPQIKEVGITNEKPVIFTSSASHFSISMVASIAGLGSQAVRLVSCDEKGRMIPCELERLIQASLEARENPFYICATAGTTVMGAFDPLNEIGRIAKKYKLWLHVDGCWGGSLIFSKRHQYHLKGSHMADSLSINPHKLLGVPIQCSFLLLKDEHVLKSANSTRADYLYHGEDYDLGSGTLGCGRKADALKMFLAWKYYGSEGFEYRVDKALANAHYLASLIRTHPKFHLVTDQPTMNVCFWFLPKSIPASKFNLFKNGYNEYLTKVTRRIQFEMMKEGKFLIDYASQGSNTPEFFRVVLNSPMVQKRHLKELVDEIERFGNEFYGKV